ncbi:unnamed protein product [Soboliphyme baturini]|uniref:BPTI/Kunitz inhibitor domain-containing protein n=1 Tax=Soboliphyme baturini TaxID=241478 RepID=A0A183I902_9BILA|nr:unnamed protein product [Soboliphyme baturini]
MNEKSLSYRQCSTASPCPSGYRCVLSGTARLCCPTPAFICQQQADAGDECTDVAFQRKYYFDNKRRECKELLYRGCSGNDNRFDSYDDCRATCDNYGTFVFSIFYHLQN